MTKMAEAGRTGPSVRSDCRIQVEFAKEGIHIHLTGKVALLYGEEIRSQLKRACETLNIKDLNITVDDSGALPFVIDARFETAVRRLGLPVPKPLLPKTHISQQSSAKDRHRRSRLYLPGNSPHLFINAGLHQSDAVILDLEDSVSPAEKDSARALVRNALVAVDFMDAEVMVRINAPPLGLEDLPWIVPYGVQTILIPKCESPRQIREIEETIEHLNPPHPFWLIPVIESAKGCFQVYDIAGASSSIAAIALGVEDYTADLGVHPTPAGLESLWARSKIVNAAKAHGIQALGSVYSNVDDDQGCREVALAGKALGFDGMACIHPRQIPIIHDAYAPKPEEIEKAKEVLRAYNKAGESGSGVAAVDSKMIDAPVIKRAKRILEYAVDLGLLKKSWMKDEGES